MYERSAIVLEKYLNKVFGQDKQSDIRISYETFKSVLEEMEKYQVITEEEEKIISEFDEIANKMQTIQKNQEDISNDTIKREDFRIKLFNDFDQAPATIEKKLLRIEKLEESAVEEQRSLREEYIQLLHEFTEKQGERNKCNKLKRTSEANHIRILNDTIEILGSIDVANVKKVKEFISADNEELNKSLNTIMLENGKNERVKFDKNVIQKAVEVRIKMAKKEAECYVLSYERLKKLMSEIDSEELNLSKYQKTLKDITSKLDFIDAEREYLVSFLDNERITAISGEKAHKVMMDQACKDFDSDMVQIHNLYNLLLREISGKSTKKAYKEFYNGTYLLGIEETEKSFNQEVNTIKSKSGVGAIINTNYWRIEGIKNIYEVFNEKVEEQYGRDLAEFMPQPEIEEVVEEENLHENDGIYEEDDDDEEWFISNKELYGDFEDEEQDDEIEDNEEDVEDDDYLDDDFAEEDEYGDFEDDEDDEEYEESDYDDNDYQDEQYEEDDYENEYDDEQEDNGEYIDEDENNADDEEDEEKEREEIRKYIKGKTKKTTRKNKKESKEEKESIFGKFFQKGKI
jgi:hypothetical protein